MFRNFVKPGAFERDGMRYHSGAEQDACKEILYENDADDQGVTSHSGKVCTISPGGNIVYANGQVNGSCTRKGGFTTSIFVTDNNSQPKRPKSDVVVSQSQDYHVNYSQSNGSLHSNVSRSSSGPAATAGSADPHLYNVQKRLSDISVANIRSFKASESSGALGNDTPTYQSGHSTKDNLTDGIRINADRNGLAVTSGSRRNEVTADGLSARIQTDARPRSYSQTKYNVIPPPPPLEEPAFAGRRDIRDPTSVHERQIVSAKGTVRGFKNRVRAGIATFWAQPEDEIVEYNSPDRPKIIRNYRQLEQGKIIIYATSMCVVRDTSERCKIVRNLLHNHMVRYDERDLYMSREIQLELKHRLHQEGIAEIRLPHVFADGIHMGGAEELEKMNEAGELRGLLDNYQKIIVRIMCEKCGGYRYIPCEFCHGSKKSLLRNHFTEEFCALRCMHCDENGLRRCDLCKDQQE